MSGILLAGATHAAEPDAGEVLARRGNGEVTQQMFDSRVSRIPEDDRPAVLRDRRRLQDILNNMLLNAQLAADARAAGLEANPEVQARMQLAAEEELAKAWLQQQGTDDADVDYHAMAREYYTANPDRYQSPLTVDVTHILVGTGERSDEEALALAQDLRARIMADPAQFSALVLEYSDDPSAPANKGSFRGVKKGQMEKAFEQAAFSLEAGGISEPVKTSYGYHLIRLDALNEPRAQSFEEVEQMLVEGLRKRQRETRQNDYLSGLTVLPVEIPDGALEAMVQRQFDEALLANPPGEAAGDR